MKKIAIITPSLAKGGVERVVVEEAKYLRDYFDVTLIVMDSFRVDYPYDGKIVELYLNWENRSIINRVYNLIKAVVKLKRLKKKERFDLIISHGELANIPNILSKGRNIIVIHENRFSAKKDFQGDILNRVLRFFYSSKYIKRVIGVSRGIIDDLIDRGIIQKEKSRYIYNPFNIDYIQKKISNTIQSNIKNISNPFISTAGRLTHQKGQWYLLRIFKEIKKRNSNLSLVILGIGELEGSLISYAKELGLSVYSRDSQWRDDYDVYFLGFRRDIFEIIYSSKLFIMTSLWEGFGNTIVEAMACGVPTVVSNCPSGPSEIVAPTFYSDKNSYPYCEYGMLLPNFENRFIDSNEPLSDIEKVWIDSIDELLKDERRLQNLSQRGLERAKYFSKDRIMREWIEVIEDSL